MQVAIFRSHNNGKTWDQGKEITEQIYGLFDHRTDGPINGMFIGSGKIHQSRYVKISKITVYMLHCVHEMATSSSIAMISARIGKCWETSTNRAAETEMNRNAKKNRRKRDVETRTNGRFLMYSLSLMSRLEKAEWGDRVSAKEMSDIQKCNGKY